MFIRAVLCILLGGGLGFYIGETYPSAQIASFAKWSMGVFAFLWTVLLGFMAKVSDVTDIPALTYEEHRRLNLIVKKKLKNLWALSRINVLASIMCSIPIVSLEQGLPVKSWVCALVGCLVGLGAFCVLLYEHWLEELREFKSDIKQRERLSRAVQEALQPTTPSTITSPPTQDLTGFERVSKPD